MRALFVLRWPRLYLRRALICYPCVLHAHLAGQVDRYLENMVGQNSSIQISTNQLLLIHSLLEKHADMWVSLASTCEMPTTVCGAWLLALLILLALLCPACAQADDPADPVVAILNRLVSLPGPSCLDWRVA